MTRISGITIESSAPLTPEEKKARSNILNRNPVAVSNAIDALSRKSAAESGAKLMSDTPTAQCDTALDVLARMENTVNRSVSGNRVPIAEWLELIRQAREVLGERVIE